MLESQDLKDFSIHKWYPIFQNISLETIIIDIPDELIAKLRTGTSDIDLLESCNEEVKYQLKNAIKKFNSLAFAKNNWHSPTDATFFSFGNTLSVTNLNELFLYFSASDILAQDFSNTKFNSYCISLKPWLNVHPASEFRCIVINNILQGITPRDWPTYYEHFRNEGPNIIRIISQTFQEQIKSKFYRKHYIFDVVINYPEKLILLDFGALNIKTNLYAFNWKEIETILKKDSSEEVAPVFRYLDSDMGIMTKTEALFKITQSQP